MKRATDTAGSEASERAIVRRRVKTFYRRFNSAEWDRCYELIDPSLVRDGKVNPRTYSELMRAFRDAYGGVRLWSTRVSMHLDASPKQRDSRPFAYVYLIWQDSAHGFHMFRERWIKDPETGDWFTRVVGLVPNKPPAD